MICICWSCYCHIFRCSCKWRRKRGQPSERGFCLWLLGLFSMLPAMLVRFCERHPHILMIYSLFIYSLCCYSSWLSYSRLACVQTWMIYLHPTWLFVAWLLFSCVFVCYLFVWVAYLSLYLQPSGFGHFLHFSSYFCKCEALCVFVSLTELVVRSRA